jgi:hypothetical protein
LSVRKRCGGQKHRVVHRLPGHDTEGSGVRKLDPPLGRKGEGASLGNTVTSATANAGTPRGVRLQTVRLVSSEGPLRPPPTFSSRLWDLGPLRTSFRTGTRGRGVDGPNPPCTGSMSRSYVGLGGSEPRNRCRGSARSPRSMFAGGGIGKIGQLALVGIAGNKREAE